MMGDKGLAVLMSIMMIPLGLVMIFKPREMWQATEGWKYRNPSAVEPSDASNAVRQLGGVVLIIISVVILIAAATEPKPKPKFEPLSSLSYVPDDAPLAPNTIAPGEPDRVVTGNISVPNTEPVETAWNFYLTVIDDTGSQVAWRHLFMSVPAGTTREFSPTAALILEDLPDGQYRWTVTSSPLDEAPISIGTFAIGPPLR